MHRARSRWRCRVDVLHSAPASPLQRCRVSNVPAPDVRFVFRLRLSTAEILPRRVHWFAWLADWPIPQRRSKKRHCIQAMMAMSSTNPNESTFFSFFIRVLLFSFHVGLDQVGPFHGSTLEGPWRHGIPLGSTRIVPIEGTVHPRKHHGCTTIEAPHRRQRGMEGPTESPRTYHVDTMNSSWCARGVSVVPLFPGYVSIVLPWRFSDVSVVTPWCLGVDSVVSPWCLHGASLAPP